MDDERKIKIAHIKSRIGFSKSSLARANNDFTFSVREELRESSNPNWPPMDYSSNHSDNINRLRRLIRDDERLLDELEDNANFVELFGQEIHDIYKTYCPELKQSTKIVHGIYGHRDVFVRLIKKGTYVGSGDYDEFDSEYINYAGGGANFWLAFVVEVNTIYYYFNREKTKG